MPHSAFEACIEACNQCAQACDHCAASCLKETDPGRMADCIRLDMDCAQICRLAAAFMSRGSQFAQTICAACADICDACGEECGRHQMEHCQAIAAACKRCAEACRQMAAMPPSMAKGQRAQPQAGAH